MKIYIAKNIVKENLYSFMRRCGYQPLEHSYIRCLAGSDYPRFHIYFQETEEKFILDLHLDQKKPSYGKETVHSGEYQSEVVEKEAERIRGLIRA